jgi:RHH-type proline utilization regulon transcriptional repressor/proline dehydrogenase/delta 1-pyrroline-5-carboxylate dehydrogenase
MGEPLYEQVVGAIELGKLNRPCRIYAPVGTHETLLAYLVRRLLENGANTSFVNRIADDSLSIDDLVADPVKTVEAMAAADGALGLPHAGIVLPRDMFGASRANSSGFDLSNEHRLASLSAALFKSLHQPWRAAPLVGADERLTATPLALLNPADRRDVVGQVFEATAQDVADAMAASVAAAPAWSATLPADRAAALERAAEAMESQMQELVGLIVREAGKTYANAIGEVREAVDFLRYYAAQARSEFHNDTHRPLGPIVCISPWNFPLAIFAGQVAAALAAGNTVLAKPAEQTPLIAAQAVQLLRRAGVAAGALQFLPGRGETVGAALVAHEHIRGVMFTGSTEVARLLQRSLAGRLDEHNRPLTLIAETGGQNAMIVDSSALVEQVVGDVITSAFDSAGQRCSALRVLCLQDEVADRALEMLHGAVNELRIGRPDKLCTDVGPVIDDDARRNIETHIAAMRANGRNVHQVAVTSGCEYGSFVLPTVIELNDLSELQREIFGPVLHVVRYRRSELGALIDKINGTGYGLTLGIHTRIDETIHFIVERANVGNQYVNRNIVGAVVGVQPFGGDGLSGTGPKAGGPLYLPRLLAQGPVAVRATAPRDALLAPFHQLRDWLAKQEDGGALVAYCDELASTTPAGCETLLPGPTGERNTYALRPRAGVLAMAFIRSDLLLQTATALAVGAELVWIENDAARQLHEELPASVRRHVHLAPDLVTAHLDAALIQGTREQISACGRSLAQRPGPIVTLQAGESGIAGARGFALARLLLERTVSENTAAAGGNASLMTIG